MIVEWFMSLASTVWGWIAGFFPAISDDQGVIITAQNFFSTIASGAGLLGAWIPWLTVSLCLAVVVPVYLAAMTVRLVRAILGHVPLIGGNG